MSPAPQTPALRRAVARARALLGARSREGVPLGPLTTYRVGGPAALFVEAADDGDLAAVAAALRASQLPVLVVGRGSNLLVADAGFPGIAVVLGPSYDYVRIEGTQVSAGAATSLPVLARRSAAAGLRGLEWAVGVPGSLGGAVRMNAGGHGSDMAAVVESYRVVDLAGPGTGRFGVAHLEYGYRRSSIGPAQVVVEATLRCRPGSRREAEAEIAEVVRWRREHQPGGQNAGSVFTNPEGDAAGRLVEAAGCKGMRLGTAAVSDKHANFVQADPGGSADDVEALVRAVALQVERRLGVRMATEIRLVGFPGTYPHRVVDDEAEA